MRVTYSLWVSLALFVTLTPLAAEAQDQIYLVERGANRIVQVAPDGTGLTEALSSLGDVIDVAIDATNGYIFWVEQSGALVQRANLDGTDVRTIASDQTNVETVAVDPAGGKVYWGGTAQLSRADLDGANAEILVTDTDLPGLSVFGMDLDPAGGKLYWGNPADATIRRVNLDGSGAIELLVRPVAGAFGVAYDPASEMVYGMDNGGSIIRADVSGALPAPATTLLSGFPASTLKDLVLDAPNNRFFFTVLDFGETPGTLAQANLDGTNLTTLVSDLASPWGLSLHSTPVVEPPSGTPDISVTPNSLRFPDTAVSESSAPQVVTITNTGTGRLDVSSITLNQSSGTSPGFQFDLSDCATPLAAEESCDLGVTFAPLSEGYNGGNFVVGTTTPFAAWKRTVYMGGTATPSTDVPMLSAPASLTFPDTPKLQTSPAQLLTLRNTGTQPLTVTSFELAWGNPSAFVVESETCTAAPLPPNATCTANLTFTPQYVGTNTASLRVVSNAANNPVQVALSSVGEDGPPLGRILTLAPQGGLYFPSTPVGESAQEFVYLRSEGSEDVTLTASNIAGADADVFSFNGTTCTATIASQTSCDIRIRFAPTEARYFTATLEITTPDGTETLRLGGSGTPNPALNPILTFDPALADVHFGTLEPGALVSQSYTVTNTGGGDAVISSVSLSGDLAFTLTQDCGTLAPTETCTITVMLDVPSSAPAWWYGAQLAVTASTQQVHYGAHFSAAVNAHNALSDSPMLTLKVDGVDAGGSIVFDGAGAETLVIANEGDASSRITLSGLTLQDWPYTFFIDGANTTCTPGLALAGGESCDVALTYTASPNAWQNGPGALRLNIDDDPWFAELALVPPSVPVIASVVSAVSMPLVAAPRTASLERVLTLTNPSSETVGLSTPRLAGAMPEAFELNSTCQGDLAAGTSCALALVYVPRLGVTSAQATVEIQVGDETHARSLTVRGTSQGAVSVASEDENELAMTARLETYPNPAQHRVTMQYVLPQMGVVRLSLYDVLGREVMVAVDGVKPAGTHAAPVSLVDLPPGTYIARLKTANASLTRMLTVRH
ncbi:MAG: hypothetical protein RhofKO_36400 [Rhodothermales bacterium]